MHTSLELLQLYIFFFLPENIVNSLEIMLNLADAGLNFPKDIEA